MKNIILILVSVGCLTAAGLIIWNQQISRQHLTIRTTPKGQIQLHQVTPKVESEAEPLDRLGRLLKKQNDQKLERGRHSAERTNPPTQEWVDQNDRYIREGFAIEDEIDIERFRIGEYGRKQTWDSPESPRVQEIARRAENLPAMIKAYRREVEQFRKDKHFAVNSNNKAAGLDIAERQQELFQKWREINRLEYHNSKYRLPRKTLATNRVRPPTQWTKTVKDSPPIGLPKTRLMVIGEVGHTDVVEEFLEQAIQPWLDTHHIELWTQDRLDKSISIENDQQMQKKLASASAEVGCDGLVILTRGRVAIVDASTGIELSQFALNRRYYHDRIKYDDLFDATFRLIEQNMDYLRLEDQDLPIIQVDISWQNTDEKLKDRLFFEQATKLILKHFLQLHGGLVVEKDDRPDIEVPVEKRFSFVVDGRPDGGVATDPKHIALHPNGENGSTEPDALHVAFTCLMRIMGEEGFKLKPGIEPAELRPESVSTQLFAQAKELYRSGRRDGIFELFASALESAPTSAHRLPVLHEIVDRLGYDESKDLISTNTKLEILDYAVARYLKELNKAWIEPPRINTGYGWRLPYPYRMMNYFEKAEPEIVSIIKQNYIRLADRLLDLQNYRSPNQPPLDQLFHVYDDHALLMHNLAQPVEHLIASELQHMLLRLASDDEPEFVVSRILNSLYEGHGFTSEIEDGHWPFEILDPLLEIAQSSAHPDYRALYHLMSMQHSNEKVRLKHTQILLDEIATRPAVSRTYSDWREHVTRNATPDQLRSWSATMLETFRQDPAILLNQPDGVQFRVIHSLSVNQQRYLMGLLTEKDRKIKNVHSRDFLIEQLEARLAKQEVQPAGTSPWDHWELKSFRKNNKSLGWPVAVRFVKNFRGHEDALVFVIREFTKKEKLEDGSHPNYWHTIYVADYDQDSLQGFEWVQSYSAPPHGQDLVIQDDELFVTIRGKLCRIDKAGFEQVALPDPKDHIKNWAVTSEGILVKTDRELMIRGKNDDSWRVIASQDRIISQSPLNGKRYLVLSMDVIDDKIWFTVSRFKGIQGLYKVDFAKDEVDRIDPNVHAIAQPLGQNIVVGSAEDEDALLRLEPDTGKLTSVSVDDIHPLMKREWIDKQCAALNDEVLLAKHAMSSKIYLATPEHGSARLETGFGHPYIVHLPKAPHFILVHYNIYWDEIGIFYLRRKESPEPN